MSFNVLNKLFKTPDYFEVGKMLFADKKDQFEEFFYLFKNEKDRFYDEYEEEIEDISEGKIKPFEVLYIFGDRNQLIRLVDWRGEENERETEKFVESVLTPKNLEIEWKNTVKLRSKNGAVNQRDGEFIIKILKSIDKDLGNIGFRLIFFNLGWDAYVFSVIPQDFYEKIIKIASKTFHGSNKLN